MKFLLKTVFEQLQEFQEEVLFLITRYINKWKNDTIKDTRFNNVSKLFKNITNGKSSSQSPQNWSAARRTEWEVRQSAFPCH